MNKFIFALLCLCVIFCTAITSAASDNKKAESYDVKLQQASKALQISGEAIAVNEGAGTITVTKKFKDKTIQVMAVTDKETKIAKGNETKSLHDIHFGDKVVVVYTKKGDVNLAKHIILQ